MMVPRSTASMENAVERMEAGLDLLVLKAKHKGYKEVESLQNRHIDDLENLLDKEEKKRKALQKDGRGDKETGEIGDGEGVGNGDTVRRNLEELLERRENRMSELVRENVRRMLEDVGGAEQEVGRNEGTGRKGREGIRK